MKRVSLENAAFAKYADQFATLLTPEAFDESITVGAVPSSGGYYRNGKWMDPFACYFRNVRVSPFGEYETLSREECGNDACRICD